MRESKHQVSGFWWRFCFSRMLLLATVDFPPSLPLEKSYFLHCRPHILIFFMVIRHGVYKDRSVRVGIIGLVFPLALVLWRFSHQPRVRARCCLPQLVFGGEAMKGTDTWGGVKLRATLEQDATQETGSSFISILWAVKEREKADTSQLRVAETGQQYYRP